MPLSKTQPCSPSPSDRVMHLCTFFHTLAMFLQRLEQLPQDMEEGVGDGSILYLLRTGFTRREELFEIISHPIFMNLSSTSVSNLVLCGHVEVGYELGLDWLYSICSGLVELKEHN
ncbi:unnamed protein product [Dovyalis caffra]|uniref:Uncharacterized protein n=1 Tax=Dovyalis caffra TaxID=77055 RepID=A0AAV1S7T0_9ROSI|nr:unnamed protein product [Dovyalis caffra]